MKHVWNAFIVKVGTGTCNHNHTPTTMTFYCCFYKDRYLLR